MNVQRPNHAWILGLGLVLAMVACQSPPPGPAGAPEASTVRPAPAAERDPGLADFDVRFPWPAFQWMNRTFHLNPDHTGSESWADHLGLAGYHDNSIKHQRRAVMSALTFGLAERWYDERGLGSPPD